MNIHKLKNITDKKGSLTPIEFKDLNFKPKRVFYVQNVPKNEERGKHAHFNTKQLLICIQGTIDVKLRDVNNGFTGHTINSGESVFVDKMIWDSQVFKTGNDILLVICSTEYNKKDYIEDWDEFLKLKKTKIKIVPKPVVNKPLPDCKFCNDTGWINPLERCICVRQWDRG